MKISNFSWPHQRNEGVDNRISFSNKYRIIFLINAYNLKFKETRKSRIAAQICLLGAGATGDMNWQKYLNSNFCELLESEYGLACETKTPMTWNLGGTLNTFIGFSLINPTRFFLDSGSEKSFLWLWHRERKSCNYSDVCQNLLHKISLHFRGKNWCKTQNPSKGKSIGKSKVKS